MTELRSEDRQTAQSAPARPEEAYAAIAAQCFAMHKLPAKPPHLGRLLGKEQCNLQSHAPWGSARRIHRVSIKLRRDIDRQISQAHNATHATPHWNYPLT